MALHYQNTGTIESPRKGMEVILATMPGNVQGEKAHHACVSSFNITEAQWLRFGGVGDDPVRFVLLPCGGEPPFPGGFSIACLASPKDYLSFDIPS
jgi:hypothetical protein